MLLSLLTGWKHDPGTDYVGILIEQATLAEGEAPPPPTTKRNIIPNLQGGWDRIVVLEVVDPLVAFLGYRPGYKLKPGSAGNKVRTRVLKTRRFRACVSPELEHYYAVGTDRKEVALRVVTYTTRDDAAYADAPFI